MKPTKNTDYAVFSNLNGKNFAMSIDKTALRHIMGVLTDLYSDPELAVLREYATNAYDSHVEAGNTDPICITLPSALHPFLVVKDQGVGLTAEEIEHVYSLYGASTKRESDEVTGVLGLGCKAALTYTNQFTLVAAKDGVQTSVSISRDEEGIGSITIVDISDTDEPNGVEITVPVKASNSFAEKAAEFFKFWPEGTVLVNGHPPERVDGLKIGENLWLTKNIAYGRASYVVMGNVPYHVDSYQYNVELPYGWGLVAHVPMGSVNFTPSREGLIYSKLTKRTLESVREAFKAGVVEAVQKNVDAAQSPEEAIKTYLYWREFVARSGKADAIAYRGMPMPKEIKASDDQTFVVTGGDVERTISGGFTRLKAHVRKQAIGIGQLTDTIWVRGFDRNFTAPCKKRLWKYCDLKGIPYPNLFILGQRIPRSPWINSKNVINWSKVAEIKLPRPVRATGSGPTTAATYPAYVWDGSELTYTALTEDEIVTSMPIFLTVKNQYDRMGTTQEMVRKHSETLCKVLDGFTYVYISANRAEKFRRLFPDARSPNGIMHDLWRFWYDDYLNDVDRKLLRYSRVTSYHQPKALQILPLRGIADPQVVGEAKFWQSPDLIARRERLTEEAGQFGPWRGDVHQKRPENLTAVLNPYPLCGTIPYDSDGQRVWKQHATLYINAVYTNSLEVNI